MFGKKRLHFATIDSTNTYAKKLARNESESGTVITADFQTAGRGRLDRHWTAPPGVNLLASFILHPQRGVEEWGGLPLLAGCAVAETLNSLAAVDAEVKWPNDVMIDGSKVCGILVESGTVGSIAWVVLGIGINVNQTVFDGEYRLPPTSLALQSGRLFEIDEVLSLLCRTLDNLYLLWEGEGNAPIIERWKRQSRMLGKTIDLVEHDSRRRVVAADIAPDGALIIRNSDRNIETVVAGDISLAPPDVIE